jgi:type I pantothenate kinase
MVDPLDELEDLLRPGIEGCRAEQVPNVIVITGSVAVGKSAIARVLADALGATTDGIRVEIVSSDGFLYPNRVLDERGLTMRKGFPESYDRDAIIAFLDAVKGGERDIRVPVYSHEDYDVLDERQALANADVVIVEGLHLLQLSNAIDAGIYVDAAEPDIEQWYIDRFFELRNTGHSFYRQFAGMSDDDVAAFARHVWATINAVNLHEFILPTRELADVVVEKARDHSVTRIRRPRDKPEASDRAAGTLRHSEPWPERPGAERRERER